MQDLSGRKLGQFELRERLGRGGMAEVYKAYQPSLDRFVAIKVMLAQLATDDSFIERFRREAQAVGRLRHPHIVQVFDFGIEDDMYYMAMEYIKGLNLKALVVKEGQLPLERALKITGQLADALAYAHNAGMIHRDMKPANIMFLDDASQHAILTDFGIARIMGQAGLTGTGMAVGTPDYMSPEAGRGDDTDHRTDIYALGIILYEMLVGQVPYSADTPLAVIMKHINAPLPTRHDYGDVIPEDVERIILKCMAKEPEDRYDNASKLQAALSEALGRINSHATTEPNQVLSASTNVSESTRAEMADNQPTTIAQPDLPTTIVPASEKGGNAVVMGLAAVVIIAILAAGAFFAMGRSDNGEALDRETETNATEDAENQSEEAIIDVAEFGQDTFTGVNEIRYRVELPPHLENLDLFTGLSEVVDHTDDLILMRQRDLAVQELDAALETDPDNIGLLFARSQAYSSEYDEELLSRQDAQRIIELAPEDPIGYIAESDSYLVYPEYDYDQAHNALMRALELAPEDPQIAWRWSQFSEWDEQLEAFDTAEELGARGWRFIRYAGYFLYDAGEYERAIPYVSMTIMGQGGSEYDVSEAQWRLMGALIQTEQNEVAFELAQHIARQAQDSEAFANLAYVAYSATEYEHATEWVNTALALDGDNVQALYVMALLAWHNDDDVDAAMNRLDALEGVEVYSIYLNFDFEHGYALDRARILDEADRNEEAITWYNAVLEDWSYVDWLYEERADLFLELGDTEAARTDLQTAMEITEDEEYRQELLQRIVELGAEPTRSP